MVLPGISRLRFMTASSIAAETAPPSEHKFGSFVNPDNPSYTQQQQHEQPEKRTGPGATGPSSPLSPFATVASGAASSLGKKGGSGSASSRKSKSRQLSLSRTLIANQWRSSPASSLARALSVSARATLNKGTIFNRKCHVLLLI